MREIRHRAPLAEKLGFCSDEAGYQWGVAKLRGAPKYIVGTLAIVGALALAVFVSKIVGVIFGALAVIVLPWVPVPGAVGGDGGAGDGGG